MKKQEILKLLRSRKIKVYVWCNVTSDDGHYFKVTKKDVIDFVKNYNDEIEIKATMHDDNNLYLN